MSSGAAVDQALAREWLRALRGRRSQHAFSRWLGYQSNIAYRWESGHCFPSASRTIDVIQKTGIDPVQALRRFFRRDQEWLSTRAPAAGAKALVKDVLLALRGRTTLAELAARTGHTRFALSRWLRGVAVPSLPEFLGLIEAMSLRRLDFIASFTDPLALPSAADAWALLEQSRRLAYEHPWTQACLRSLELVSYRALPAHDTAWIAKQLGITPADAQLCLSLLERTGQVEPDGQHLRPRSLQLVDTRSDPAAARRLKRWWLGVALERLEQGRPGVYSYNVSAVSRADLRRLEELQRAYYRQLTQIIEASTIPECVVLFNAQLLALTAAEDS